MAEPVRITDMRTSHGPEVLRIYREGIATGQATFETNVPAWDAWDADHLRFARLVAEVAEEVVGWAALSPVSRRQVYRGVAEVSVYVDERWRGRAIGRALLERLIAAAEANGIWTLQASIFPENTASLALHQELGFRLVGRRERIGQHHGIWRDTLLLERRSSAVGG
jgi:phosphinothricin acetyltransferase